VADSFIFPRGGKEGHDETGEELGLSRRGDIPGMCKRLCGMGHGMNGAAVGQVVRGFE
jgi:hypothetical protein